MKQEDFKELFDGYDFNEEGVADTWEKVKKTWQTYHDAIKGDKGKSLTIKDWLSYTKDEDGKIVTNDTIVKFIHSGTSTTSFKFFSSAGLHGWSNVMVYSTRSEDSITYTNKYNDSEQQKKTEVSFDDAEKAFNDYIIPLLQKAIGKTTVEEIDDFFMEAKKGEKDSLLAKKNGSFFNALFILESILSGSNNFAYITALENIEVLESLFYTEKENEGDNLEEHSCIWRNNRVYKRALEWSGIELKDEDTKHLHEQLKKLNSMLWTLSDESYLLFTDLLNPNIIFSGAPSTGKTYSVEKTIKLLQSMFPKSYPSDPPTKYTQFHPSYTYQDFIEGIKPTEIDDNGNLKLELTNGSFKRFCIEVRKRNEKMWKKLTKDGKKPQRNDPSSYEGWPHYYYVVDEINRGNLSNIFGETFTLLEYRDFDFSGKNGKYTESSNALVETPLSNVILKLYDRKSDANQPNNGNSDANKTDNKDEVVYKLIVNNGKAVSAVFGIPFNIHFIGMMNDVDRSIDAFDLAFRRRFKWQPTFCDYKVIRAECGLKKEEERDAFVNACKVLNYYITGDDADKPENVGKITSQRLGLTYQIGHGYFLNISKIFPTSSKSLKTRAEVLFDNYIRGTLREYLVQNHGDGKEIDTILDTIKKDFLAQIPARKKQSGSNGE